MYKGITFMSLKRQNLSPTCKWNSPHLQMSPDLPVLRRSVMFLPKSLHQKHSPSPAKTRQFLSHKGNRSSRRARLTGHSSQEPVELLCCCHLCQAWILHGQISSEQLLLVAAADSGYLHLLLAKISFHLPLHCQAR